VCVCTYTHTHTYNKTYIILNTLKISVFSLTANNLSTDRQV